MRIESNPSPSLNSPLPSATAAGSAAESPGFQQILARLTEPPAPRPAPPTAQPATGEAEAYGGPRDFSRQELQPLPAPPASRSAEDEQEANEALEEADLELMEDPHEELDQIEKWEEDNQELHEDLWHPDEELRDLSEEESEGREREPEGEGEIMSDHEELPLPPQHPEYESKTAGQAARWQLAEAESSQERKLNYAEIQALVDTVLNAERHLPPRVRHILQDLLNALLDGQRQLLDQHRLIGLDPAEWELLSTLFPPHFYAGWLRQQRLRNQDLPLYVISQDLFVQAPPNAQRQAELETLLGYAFGELPVPVRSWLHDKPPLFDTQDLKHSLEIWVQHQALPPGAIGQTLQLAMTYHHHPETMSELFGLSQSYLHRRPLSESQLRLVTQKLYERCFPPLSDEQQTVAILNQVLQGQEPDEESLMRLLLGCDQAVLSYLPYAYLPTSLQEIQDYVRRDLFGQEERLPGLFKDE